MNDVVVIGPVRGWRSLGIAELWRYRELLYFLAWRDVKVRYKQTAFGAAWAVIQPFMLMVVFSLFLGNLADVPSDGVPYPIFTFSALVPWTLFQQSLTASVGSLVADANLVSKVYFPRIVLPIAAVGSYLIDAAVSLVVLGGMMVWYDVPLRLATFWVVPLIALTALTALAIGTFLAALNVKYRDVRYAVPFLVQLWLFASPVAYPSSIVPDGWHGIYALNPMAGVIEGFRWSLLGTGERPGTMALASTAVTFVVLIVALAYFQRAQRTFADVI